MHMELVTTPRLQTADMIVPMHVYYVLARYHSCHGALICTLGVPLVYPGFKSTAFVDRCVHYCA